MSFNLPELNYSFDALEPHIDAKTMEIHHDKHHATYVNNLNAALEGTEWADKSIEEIITSLSSLPSDKQTAVRNNGGGHFNHSLFWTILKADGGHTPSGDLAEAIDRDFGSFDEFKKQFGEAATKRFGSGWAWLVSKDGKLSITSTPNQDNPLMDDASVKLIIGLDVWEHAYYLAYQNRRPDYVNAFWNIVDWDEAERRFNT